jgi:hypothetical protein
VTISYYPVSSYPVSSQPIQITSIGYTGLVVVGTDNKTLYKLSSNGTTVWAGSQGNSIGALAYDPTLQTFSTRTYWAISANAPYQLFKIVFGPTKYQVTSTLIGSLGPIFSSGTAGSSLAMTAAGIPVATSSQAIVPIQLSKTTGNGTPVFGVPALLSNYITAVSIDNFNNFDQFFFGESGNPGGNYLWTILFTGSYWQQFTPLTYADNSAANASVMTQAPVTSGGNIDPLWILDNVNHYLSFCNLFYGNINITAASVAAYPGMTWGTIPW